MHIYIHTVKNSIIQDYYIYGRNLVQECKLGINRVQSLKELSRYSKCPMTSKRRNLCRTIAYLANL